MLKKNIERITKIAKIVFIAISLLAATHAYAQTTLIKLDQNAIIPVNSLWTLGNASTNGIFNNLTVTSCTGCGSGGGGGSAAGPITAVQYAGQSGTSTVFNANPNFNFSSSSLTLSVPNLNSSSSIAVNATTTNLFTSALNLGASAISYIQSLFSGTPPITVSGSGVIACNVASGSQPGCLASADWTTFNGKQAAGNYVTALTGDVTASGPGSVAATLATVNSNVGTFGSASSSIIETVNGKGLITSISTTTPSIPVGDITGVLPLENGGTGSTTLNTTLVPEGATNLYYTAERYQDNFATSFIQNGTGITWTYNDPANTIEADITTVPAANGGTGTTSLANLTVSSSNLSITGGQKVLAGTSTQITLTATPTFTGLITTNSTTTNATTTNSFTTNATSTNIGATNLNTTNLTIGGITGTTSCIQANTNGVISGTGSPCGSSGGSGTVTSVAMTVPTGLSIGGSPITNSGTLALSLTAGYVIPLTASTTAWNNLLNASTSLGNYITALTGDITAAGPGSAAATLATVNTNTGSWGSSSAIPNFTVNGKGLITAAGTNAVVAPAGTLTGTTLASNVVTSSLTSLGTIANLTATNASTTNLTVSGQTYLATTSVTGPITSTGSVNCFAFATSTCSTALGSTTVNIVGSTTINGSNGASGLTLSNLKNAIIGTDANGNFISTTTSVGVTSITAGTNITLSSGATCTSTCTINATGGGSGTNYWSFSGTNLFPATTTSFVTADHYVASSTTTGSSFASPNLTIGSSTDSIGNLAGYSFGTTSINGFKYPSITPNSLLSLGSAVGAFNGTLDFNGASTTPAATNFADTSTGHLAGIGFNGTASDTLQFINNQSGGGFDYVTGSGQTETILDNGNFGIGTNTPSSALSVNGDIYSTGVFTSVSTTGTSTITNALKVGGSNTQNNELSVTCAGTYSNSTSQGGCVNLNNTNNSREALVIYNGPNGTPSAQTPYLERIQNASTTYGGTSLSIISNSTQASNTGLVIDSNTIPAIAEIDEAASTSPGCGKYQISDSNNEMRIEGRNTGCTSFTSFGLFSSQYASSTGKITFFNGISDGAARLELFGTSSIADLLDLTSLQGATDGNILKVSEAGNVSIGSSTATSTALTVVGGSILNPEVVDATSSVTNLSLSSSTAQMAPIGTGTTLFVIKNVNPGAVLRQTVCNPASAPSTSFSFTSSSTIYWGSDTTATGTPKAIVTATGTCQLWVFSASQMASGTPIIWGQ